MPSRAFFLKGCKYALITYSQCGSLDPWAVVNMFSTHRAECIIGRELHADGGVHLHCFIDFGRQFSSRKADVFDVGGCHPNIVKSYGTPEKGYDYAIKDGDVVAGGLERPLSGQSGSGSSTARIVWTTITMAEDAEEFWRLCHELAPEHVCRSFNSLAKYAEWRYRPVDEPYATPDGVWIDASTIDGINEWIAQASLGSGPLGLRYVGRLCGAFISLLFALGGAVPWRVPTPLPRGLGGAPGDLL